ncbi:hypothetical protein DFH06DRAFT_1141538 [Mycena polygramma]|nr:hypothetical protein DFH06DRAFT_1141538 [Mycena polygramma]
MTPSALPSDTEQFSYNFPVLPSSASSSASSTRATHSLRTHSPAPAELDVEDESDADDADDAYDALGYPHIPARHIQLPRTGNQWQQTTPSPPLYPYTSPYPDPLMSLSAYWSTLSLPRHSGLSFESTASVLGPASGPRLRSSSWCPPYNEEKHAHAKIRKLRRSVDSDSRPSPLRSASSPAFSPLSYGNTEPPLLYDYPHSLPHTHSHSLRSPLAHAFPDIHAEEEKEYAPRTRSLRRQWAALVLRVRFGVFHALRRIRCR